MSESVIIICKDKVKLAIHSTIALANGIVPQPVMSLPYHSTIVSTVIRIMEIYASGIGAHYYREIDPSFADAKAFTDRLTAATNVVRDALAGIPRDNRPKYLNDLIVAANNLCLQHGPIIVSIDNTTADVTTLKLVLELRLYDYIYAVTMAMIKDDPKKTVAGIGSLTQLEYDFVMSCDIDLAVRNDFICAYIISRQPRMDMAMMILGGLRSTRMQRRSSSMLRYLISQPEIPLGIRTAAMYQNWLNENTWRGYEEVIGRPTQNYDRKPVAVPSGGKPAATWSLSLTHEEIASLSASADGALSVGPSNGQANGQSDDPAEWTVVRRS